MSIIHTPLCSVCHGAQTVTLAADPGVLWPCPACAVGLDDEQDDRIVDDWAPWSEVDEDAAAWLWDDDVQRRRADR